MRLKNLFLVLKSKKVIVPVLLLGLSMLVSACSVSLTGTGSVNNPDIGGVSLSVNDGSTWQSASAIPSVTGQPGSISSLNDKALVIDPSDNAAVYFLSYGQGLFYTYNILGGWTKVTSLPTATINALAVDPKNKCHIYATIANHLYQTVDCSRTWQTIYVDDDQTLVLTTVAIDYYNPSNIYLGTSRGDIMKSIDSGVAWRTLKHWDNDGIASLVLSPSDSRYLFVATQSAKLYSFYTNTNTNTITSADVEANFAVNNFSDLNSVLANLNIGTDFRNLIIVPSDNKIFLATGSAILRSSDNGISWEKLRLLVPDKNAVIKALAVDPKNSQNIYYVTDSSFFRSTDGGVTWISKRLTTSRAGSALLIDYKNPNIIYLGFNSGN